MLHKKKKYTGLILVLICFSIHPIYSGPPFDTDDPEPVSFKHWEYYISSINTRQIGIWSGTAPHIELNYGLIQNVQVHLLLPLNYIGSQQHSSSFGYADTEFGIKFRFVQESEHSPIKNSEFSSGKTKIYLPIWLQKSWGKLTSYGGAGYWINPGTNNKNWIFSGWEIQYDFSKIITLGGELYYHSANTKESTYETGFNIGGSLNPTEKFHLIFSAGHTFTKDNTFTSYLGLLWTI